MQETLGDEAGVFIIDGSEFPKHGSHSVGVAPWGTELWGFSSRGTIDRKDFGLTWNMALESGGWLVGDTVQISAELELTAAEVPAGQEAAAMT